MDSETISEWKPLMRLVLLPHHLRPGRCKQSISDSKGVREFAPVISLTIVRDAPTSFYLLYESEDGTGADTWHMSLEDALHQAEYEFDAHPSEWITL